MYPHVQFAHFLIAVVVAAVAIVFGMTTTVYAPQKAPDTVPPPEPDDTFPLPPEPEAISEPDETFTPFELPMGNIEQWSQSSSLDLFLAETGQPLPPDEG